MSQGNLNRTTMERQSHSPHIDSSQSKQISPNHQQKVQNEGHDGQLVKNRRWSQTEHILFILFLEQNRQKIKSKLIRRSNTFFREMSAFISSKNSTQCRSYHQKYECKYKFPHRIIRQQKQKIDLKLYQQIFTSKQSQIKTVNREKKQHEEEDNESIPMKRERVSVASAQCQTNIQGVATIFIQRESPAYQPQQIKMVSMHPFMNPYPFIPPYYPHPFYQG